MRTTYGNLLPGRKSSAPNSTSAQVAQSGLGELQYFPTLPKIELNCRSEGRPGGGSISSVKMPNHVVIAAFCANTTCGYSKIYDQAGNSNALTAVNKAPLTFEFLPNGIQTPILTTYCSANTALANICSSGTSNGSWSSFPQPRQQHFYVRRDDYRSRSLRMDKRLRADPGRRTYRRHYQRNGAEGTSYWDLHAIRFVEAVQTPHGTRKARFRGSTSRPGADRFNRSGDASSPKSNASAEGPRPRRSVVPITDERAVTRLGTTVLRRKRDSVQQANRGPLTRGKNCA